MIKINDEVENFWQIYRNKKESSGNSEMEND